LIAKKYKQTINTALDLESIPEHSFDLSSIIIPFSALFSENELHQDIYTGEELIPFKKRDIEFKKTLLHEFLNSN